ncbi:hypothetical protein VTN31DRAFT_1290 [Thermomyces dupontii]|uniref:mitochondrial 37S ribosomal protein uS15m n=1 Tax=Talaromyces thermophilus TaxID=28565 RepID=UPI0037433368
MPPRISLLQSFKPFTGSRPVQSPLAAFSRQPCKVTIRAGSAEARERRKHDPYLMALARQRKAANITRQKQLREERQQALGDPVKSAPTPFIQSLQSLRSPTEPPKETNGALNYFLNENELKEALEYSKELSSPVPDPNRNLADPHAEEEAAKRHEEEHRNAQEAINRIVSLSNGNTKDRMRVNIQRCIETFGRHNTDKFLPPKPSPAEPGSHPEKTPRSGPDTGSPEVQIAILTTKILNLQRHLENTKKDRHNKRNLRLLVHKRQKLLRYLRRKERGGPRFQYVMETLGLSDAAWKGEISL